MIGIPPLTSDPADATTAEELWATQIEKWGVWSPRVGTEGMAVYPRSH